MRTRDQGDTVQLSKVRLKTPLHSALEADAALRAITINGALADVLERAYQAQKDGRELLTFLFGKRLAGLLLLIGHAMVEAERIAKQKGRDGWLNDPETFEFVVNYARSLLAGVAPKGEATAAEQQRLARNYASVWPLLAPVDERLEPIKEMLGDELIARLTASDHGVPNHAAASDEPAPPEAEVA